MCACPGGIPPGLDVVTCRGHMRRHQEPAKWTIRPTAPLRGISSRPSMPACARSPKATCMMRGLSRPKRAGCSPTTSARSRPRLDRPLESGRGGPGRPDTTCLSGSPAPLGRSISGSLGECYCGVSGRATNSPGVRWSVTSGGGAATALDHPAGTPGGHVPAGCLGRFRIGRLEARRSVAASGRRPVNPQPILSEAQPFLV